MNWAGMTSRRGDNEWVQVLNSNPKIRFTGVLNSRGDLIANKNRSNSPLLSDNEVKMAIHYTFDRWTNLQNLEFKLGKEQESITNYEEDEMDYDVRDPNSVLVHSLKMWKSLGWNCSILY